MTLLALGGRRYQSLILRPSLEEAHTSGKLLYWMKTQKHPSLLGVDESGYMPLSRTGATHFLRLMSRRYEHAATLLTINESFDEWAEIFGDEVMARH